MRWTIGIDHVSQPTWSHKPTAIGLNANSWRLDKPPSRSEFASEHWCRHRCKFAASLHTSPRKSPKWREEWGEVILRIEGGRCNRLHVEGDEIRSGLDHLGSLGTGQRWSVLPYRPDELSSCVTSGENEEPTAPKFRAFI